MVNAVWLRIWGISRIPSTCTGISARVNHCANQSSKETSILDKLIQIAEQFNPNGPVVSVKEYGTGNVNDTYLVTLDALGKNKYFSMQRINQHVFHQPELIMLNMSALSDHVRARLEKEDQD